MTKPTTARGPLVQLPAQEPNDDEADSEPEQDPGERIDEAMPGLS